jgi:hypothetical protein
LPEETNKKQQSPQSASCSPGLDLNMGLPKYEAEVLTNQLQLPKIMLFLIKFKEN